MLEKHPNLLVSLLTKHFSIKKLKINAIFISSSLNNSLEDESICN